MSKVAIQGDPSGSGTFTIASPNSNSNYTLTLPIENGTILTTGVTTGLNASALSTGTVPKARMFAGAVLQVVTATKTDTTSFAGQGTWWNISGVSASITPSSTSSRILVLCVTMYSATNGYNGVNFAMARNGTRTPIGDASGTVKVSAFWGSDDVYGNFANADQAILMFVDSPSSTSSVSYQLQGQNARDNETIYINREAYDIDNVQTTRGVSTITLMEIAG